MSEYQPGTVAIATVRGVKGVKVVNTDGDEWFSINAKDVGGRWHYASDGHVTDIRVLPVLDLYAPHSLWVDELRRVGGNNPYAGVIADQIEATYKPPRIPEPGEWGVVSACLTDEAQVENCKGPLAGTYVRSSQGMWRHADSGYGVTWNELHDPVLVREGVES